MKIKVLQESFSGALAIASRFINPRVQLPILGNILLKTEKTKLIVASTNLEVSASITIGAQIEKEGEITIPGKVIAEVIANLPKETITLEGEMEQLKIKTGSFSSSVLGMNSADFPSFPFTLPKKETINLSRKDISEALSLVLFASSADETRPTLTGVLFIFEKGNLTLVAADGFRLSQKKLEVKGVTQEQKIILPKSILFEISRNNQGEGDLVLSFNKEEKQVVFGGENSVFSSRVIEGDFPSFEKIIPKKSTTTVIVEKEDFVRAVKLASVFAREAANIVKINTGKDALVFSAESSSAGNQQTKIEAKVEGAETEISFNYRFLEEFLHSIKGESVKIGLSGGSSPAVFTDLGEKNFLHLIMPVKVQG